MYKMYNIYNFKVKEFTQFQYTTTRKKSIEIREIAGPLLTTSMFLNIILIKLYHV